MTVSVDVEDLGQSDRDMLARATAAIRAMAPDAEVILFGSRAEGTARLDSDFDLLVVANTQDRFQLAMALTEALEPIFPSGEFDLVVIPRHDWDRVRTLRGFVPREADLHGIRLGV